MIVCPLCGKKMKSEALKSLWGQASRQRGLKLPVSLKTKCCQGAITYDELKSLWGSATSARRKKPVAGPGRPKGSYSKEKRCPCGDNTLARAAKRRFKCCRNKGISVAVIAAAKEEG